MEVKPAIAEPRYQPAPQVVRWMAFLRAHLSGFRAWPDEIFQRYLEFHAQQGGVGVVVQENAVLALGVGWRTRESDLERHWAVNDPTGDSFYFAHLVSVQPGALCQVIGEFHRRYPDWPTLKLFGRRGQRGIVRYRPELIQRLAMNAYRKEQHERQL